MAKAIYSSVLKFKRIIEWHLPHGRKERLPFTKMSCVRNHSKIKSSGCTPKRVTSGGIHLCGLALGQHSYEETSQRCRAVGDTVSDLTKPGIEPQTSSTESVILTTELTIRLPDVMLLRNSFSNPTGDMQNCT